MIRRRLFCALFVLVCTLCLCITSLANDENEAPAITEQCKITVSSNAKLKDAMFTSEYETYWYSEPSTSLPYVEIRAPKGQPIHGLYIEWAYHPGDWVVTVKNPAWEAMDPKPDPNTPNAIPEWITAYEGGRQNLLHEYLPIDGITHLRIEPRLVQSHGFAIAGLRVLGAGKTLPAWVQRWEPIPQRVDLMVISTHPDDEWIFLGGTLPTYGCERGLATAVVYMTYGARHRQSELLNGLWTGGIHTYPVMGDFIDVYTKSYDEAIQHWGDAPTASFIVEQIRRYQPKVVVAQDLEGEYGHGMHKLTARQTLRAVESLAGDAAFAPESAKAYGVYQPEKLYLHLYDKNKVTMNWRKRLPSLDGRTAFDIAEMAFAEHQSQQGYFQVLDKGKHNNALFGLAFTRVGKDGKAKDFFQNVTPYPAAQ